MTALNLFVPTLPDNAPFSPTQRAWLNGFLAGLIGTTASSTAAAPIAAPVTAPQDQVADDDDDDLPWHDAALDMGERLQLAKGRPLKRKLMAAMAQLDCGACGYQCQTYAAAIADGSEKDLSRCAPGGKETTRMLKKLVTENGDAIVPVEQVTVRGRAKEVAKTQGDSGVTRNNPARARLIESRRLNGPGSTKDTRHIAFDLQGTGITYSVGDSLGVWPENCPDTADWLIDALGASGAEDVPAVDGTKISLREALLHQRTVTAVNDDVLELLANFATDEADRARLMAMLDEDGPGVPDDVELLDLLLSHPSARPTPEAFVAALRPLQPRLYSISSSLAAHPEQVHLTVGVVRYCNSTGRQCKGVASTFLAERLKTGMTARIFVQPSPGFAPPADKSRPVIMVGPGTGIAPFRAFLQDRRATAATGKNWLLFGDQHAASDFLYREELEAHQADGLLTRLDTAFSRDGDAKVYVQHRMLENAAELWRWLKDDGHFYVCGDAKRMAADVDAALQQVVAEQGELSPEDAAAYVKAMAKENRYVRDVY